MAVGLSYLAAKAAEYTSTLDWVVNELASLPTLSSDHPHVEQCVSQRVRQARGRISQLRMVIQLNVPSLVPRGVSIVNELQFDFYVLSGSYIPALKKETPPESQVGRLATKAALRCGLTGVREILVNLSGGHAMLSAFQGCPLMFAPPHQRHTLVQLAAIYHEFGHIVFNARPEIRQGLARICAEYFRALDQAGGFMNQAAREERRRQINQARAYWTMRRLAEAFCDIFATFTTGPAYYYLCVDMALRHRDDPYEIDITDEHPPWAARVSVSKRALLITQLASEVGQKASALWEHHVRSTASNSDFRLWCGADLLEALVNETTALISGPNGFLRYTGRGDHPQITPESDTNLQELLNESTRMLLLHPDKYAAWEKPYIDALFQ